MAQVTPADLKLNVSVRELAPQPYLGTRLRAATGSVGATVQGGFVRLFSQLESARKPPLGPPFLIASEPRDGFMEIELGVPCASPAPTAAGLHAATLPGGRAAVATYRGRYEDIGPAYEALANWIAAHGHIMAGPPREVYLTGPADVARPEDHLTELIWPIA